MQREAMQRTAIRSSEGRPFGPRPRRRSLALSSLALLVSWGAAGAAWAGAHTWDVNEVFSNADGSIQFIELRENNGTPNETGVGNQTLSSNAQSVNMGLRCRAHQRQRFPRSQHGRRPQQPDPLRG